VLIKNGGIVFKNDNLKITNLSLLCDDIPMFLNLSVNNIYTSKNIDAEFSTILNEKSTDKIINPYLTYPINIKGEIPVSGDLKGRSDNYTANFDFVLPKNSDIYFSGANLGDETVKREFIANINVAKNLISVNNLRLIKHIANQNNKINLINVIGANGKIVQSSDNNFYFDEFRVQTASPVNVRLLNLIFKKSILKNGNFECAINLDGSVKLPKVTGKVFLQDLDIPLYDAIVNQIKFNINKNFIDGFILAKNQNSDIEIALKAKNNLKSPYEIEDFSVISSNLNVSEMIKNLNAPLQKTDIFKKQEFQDRQPAPYGLRQY